MWQTPSKSWHHPSKINHRVNPKMGSDFCSKDRGPHKRLPRCVGKCAETWPVPACLLVMRYLAHNARCMCARDGTCSVRWVSNCAQPRDESTYEHAPEFSCASHQTEWVSCLRWSDGVRTVSPTPYTASQRNSVAAGMDLLLGCMWLFSVPRNPKNAGKTGCTQVSAWRVRAARWINGWLAGCLFGWMVWWMHGWKCVKVEMTVNNSWCSLVSWCACIDIMFTWKCKPMFSYFSYMYILPVLMHELVECLTLHANSPDVTSIPNPFLENRLPKKTSKSKQVYLFLVGLWNLYIPRMQQNLSDFISLSTNKWNHNQEYRPKYHAWSCKLIRLPRLTLEFWNSNVMDLDHNSWCKYHRYQQLVLQKSKPSHFWVPNL